MDEQRSFPSCCPHHPYSAKIVLTERAASGADWESIDSDLSQPHPSVHAPVPTRPIVPQRNSSGTVVHTTEDTNEPVETQIELDGARPMSPRRTNEHTEALGREMHAELSRHAKALQESLHLIFSRIEAIKEEYDKLDSNNKLLQKYIGDLTSTSKITASSSRERN